jgi:hypothetical protein
MRKRTGPSRKERRAAAEKMLLALLRTPKTRAGLVAAACTHEGISKNFVYGWLVEAGRSGVVTMLRSVNPVQYQATDSIVVERPAESGYPAWLEPRTLPTSIGRHVVINGKPIKTSGVQATWK